MGTKIQRCTCSTCHKSATWEDHVGWFLHDGPIDGSEGHRVTRLVGFDEGPRWHACDSGATWNGFAVPYVTPEVREEIAAFCATANGVEESEADAELAAEIRALPEIDGLVEIDLGLTFWWVEP